MPGDFVSKMSVSSHFNDAGIIAMAIRNGITGATFTNMV